MARAGRRRNRIAAGDLAGYGSVSNGTVDIGRAARGLGASKTEVRQAIRQAESAPDGTPHQGNALTRRKPLTGNELHAESWITTVIIHAIGEFCRRQRL